MPRKLCFGVKGEKAIKRILGGRVICSSICWTYLSSTRPIALDWFSGMSHFFLSESGYTEHEGTSYAVHMKARLTLARVQTTRTMKSKAKEREDDYQPLTLDACTHRLGLDLDSDCDFDSDVDLIVVVWVESALRPMAV